MRIRNKKKFPHSFGQMIVCRGRVELKRRKRGAHGKGDTRLISSQYRVYVTYTVYPHYNLEYLEIQLFGHILYSSPRF